MDDYDPPNAMYVHTGTHLSIDGVCKMENVTYLTTDS
jgi:hypothetical protein